MGGNYGPDGELLLSKGGETGKIVVYCVLCVWLLCVGVGMCFYVFCVCLDKDWCCSEAGWYVFCCFCLYI